jgi:hypothetical protein
MKNLKGAANRWEALKLIWELIEEAATKDQDNMLWRLLEEVGEEQLFNLYENSNIAAIARENIGYLIEHKEELMGYWEKNDD